MKIKLYILLVIFVSISIKTIGAQTNDSIPKYETFTIESKHVGDIRTINVWSPPKYSTHTDSLPVLYMLDGGIEEDFPHIANTLAELIVAKKIPPILLVGIQNTERRRDLTGFTVVEKDKIVAPKFGGSTTFRAFISEELFAEVNSRYRTNKQKGIIGESFAGLFVVETLLLQPNLFDFYIAFDPSLWWNDKYLLKTANKLLETFPNTPKTFWFAGSGAKDIYKSTGKLASILQTKNIQNLHWKFSPERKEKHHTIFRATKEKALIWTLNDKVKP
ncbi:MAG: alpha/beta hydrolase-fold protein [Saprospiraceae bacterium]